MEIKPGVYVVLLIVVVGLAGCSGQTTSDSAVSYPNGYNESGITDPELAADQHTTALSEHDNYTETMNLTSPKFEGYVATTIRMDSAERRSAAEMEINKSGEPFRDTKMYHNGTKRHTNTQIDVYNDTYTMGNESLSAFRESLMNASEIDRWLTNISFEEAGTVTHNGDTLYRYNATDVDDPEAFFYSSEFSMIDAVESVDSTLLVDEEGIIRSFNVTVTYSSDGETQAGMMSYRITDIDSTTVEEPDWLTEIGAKTGSNDSESGTER